MSDFKPRFLRPTQTSSYLDRNESSAVETTDFIYNKHLSQSIQTQRQRLPIFNNRNHILFLLEKYQTLVLIGETGSGKSTQIPQVSKGPSSQISKLLLTLLILVVIFYIYMDYNLYVRIHDYPFDNDDNNTLHYQDVTWVTCHINPLCDVTVKAVLLDHTNYYLFAPLVQIVDDLLKISETKWITPNSISFFHIFVAVLSAKCISSNNLAYRRIGVVLFEFRTWLDDLDGHVARVRKHIKGGAFGDRHCRGYIQLPTTVDCKETNVVYNLKVTTKKVVSKVLCFSFQLIVSSIAWNRYIALYQDLLESTDVKPIEAIKQNEVFQSSFFFTIAWLWRVINVHSLTHLLLLAIFCDKLWEFLKNIQYIGYGVLLSVYLIEAEWPGQVGVCEPRRIAAISLANRVADETGSIVQQDTVGYAVRFDACTNKPKIKYMTEGILLREMMADPLLKNYCAIMLDEVHERTLYTDILMGLMKKILKKRKELRLIVASATLDAEELQQFFNNNPSDDKKQDTSVILSVEARQFTIDIFYVAEPVPCYVQASVDTVLSINSSKDQGDVLVFLTGQEEVERAVRLLNEHATLIEQSKKKELMLVLPMYGSLPYYEQLKVFKPAPNGYRKVVVATNVAETSVTIPGIVHVIDCGFVKMKWFNNETHTDSLMTLPISKASASQRAGRAGRLRSGKVYRLYTEEDASNLAEDTPPEMVRSNLTYAILQLKAMGIDNILKFKLPSPPPLENLKSALEILYALDVIDIQGKLTKPLGFHMAEFALDPFYSKILLSSGEFGCSEEILTIISMLQVETVFSKPSSGNSIIRARIQKRLFEVEEGDLITYLNVYNGFIQSEMSQVEIRSRLEKMLKNYDVPIESCIGSTDAICKCLVKGLFANAAYLHHSGIYKTIRGDIELHVHPDSVLYTIPQPQWVIFCEVVHTHKLYMKDLTVIKSEWLLELAPHFYYKTFDN
ncbi:hypothetical protein NQ315_004267 [Exocentrus adspersus]|uniref:ATP-dependent RNA helicase DHX35 n=1 Tax=Exocentrus adspersus TaxID=1586481 RepID=A0AAV8W790_9CUCU|nr:hypothetical protein NQ315_004267 [Exocentrus adspersus]